MSCVQVCGCLFGRCRVAVPSFYAKSSKSSRSRNFLLPSSTLHALPHSAASVLASAVYLVYHSLSPSLVRGEQAGKSMFPRKYCSTILFAHYFAVCASCRFLSRLWSFSRKLFAFARRHQSRARDRHRVRRAQCFLRCAKKEAGTGANMWASLPQTPSPGSSDDAPVHRRR